MYIPIHIYIYICMHAYIGKGNTVGPLFAVKSVDMFIVLAQSKLCISRSSGHVECL